MSTRFKSVRRMSTRVISVRRMSTRFKKTTVLVATPQSPLEENEEHPDDAEPQEAGKTSKKSKIAPKSKRPTQKVKAPKKEEGDGGPAPKTEKAPAVPKKRKAKVVAEKGANTKKQKLNGYGIKHGESPFPDLVQPTPEQCEEVVEILSKYHINSIPPKAVPPPSLKIAGCGEVPAVHDALLRTRISAATQTSNANNAIENLVKVYGIAQSGNGKGSIDWNAVRLGSREKLLQALKCGGLAGVKSKDIKEILDLLVEQNKLRCEKLVAEGKKLTEEDHDPLSLQHIKEMNTEEAYVALIQFPGIGVKTAACVILFCLQRPCYAVDTHVWRLTKDLGWVPPKANEIKTFAHCQVRVPDEYKYKLHQLFWHHGQECVRCRADTTEKSKGWEEGCPIDHLVTRVRKVRKVVALAAKVEEETEAEAEAEAEDEDVLDLVDEDEDAESDALSKNPKDSLVDSEMVIQTRYATRSRKVPDAVAEE